MGQKDPQPPDSPGGGEPPARWSSVETWKILMVNSLCTPTRERIFQDEQNQTSQDVD